MHRASIRQAGGHWFEPSTAHSKTRWKRRVFHYSHLGQRSTKPRTQELFDELMQAPHLTALDAVAVRNIARLEAFIEACDAELHRNGITSGRKVKAIIRAGLAASERLLPA